MKFTAIVALALSAVAVSAKCHPKKIAYLEDNVKHPAQLCQFWLRGHIDRNYSPLPNLNGHQLTNVCDCYLKQRGLEPHHLTRYKKAPLVGTCDQTLADDLAVEFNSTRYFCEYYVNDQKRHYSPINKLTPQNIFDGCSCYLIDPFQNSTSSTTQASTTAASTTISSLSVSASTTAASTTAASTTGVTSIPTTTVSTASLLPPVSTTSTVLPTTFSTTFSISLTGLPGTGTGTGLPVPTANSTNGGLVRRSPDEQMAKYMAEVNGSL